MNDNNLTKVKECKDILYRVSQDFPEEGVKFIDLTPTLLNTTNRMKTLSKLVNHIENEIIDDVNYIISPDARGFLWGMGVATLMSIGFIPVRKTGKLPQNCIFDTVEYTTEYSTTSLDLPIVDLHNKNVVFVDDVYATGGTYKACKELVESVGGHMLEPVVIYDVGLTNDEVFSICRGNL